MSEPDSLALVPGLQKAPPRDLALPMKLVARTRPGYATGKPKLMVCINERGPGEGTSCAPRGGCDIHQALLSALEAEAVDVEVVTARCLGTCDRGPTLRLAPNNSWFYGAHVGDVATIVEQLRSADAEYRQWQSRQAEPT
jgi:(2Fe-2S) ferredoxin